MSEKRNQLYLWEMAVIGLCFLLSSTAWLAWEYHLLAMVSPGFSDVMCMVVGYLLQAAGIGLFAFTVYRNPGQKTSLFVIALFLHTVCLLPAILSPSIAVTLLFGFLMNLSGGLMAGAYLERLSSCVPAGRQASAFGWSYGISILLSWLLSMLHQIYYSTGIWFICALLSAAILMIIQKAPETQAGQMPQTIASKPYDKKIIFSASALVLLFGIVNSCGFAFPGADLSRSIKVEQSRLFYAAGLIIAGLITDHSRKQGSICALTALVIPFILLALRSEPVPASFFWMLSYFTFGFYALYRVILFLDLSAAAQTPYLAVFGLMIGRIGEAAGEGICIGLSGRLSILVGIAGLFFIASVVVFFQLYQTLYVTDITGPRNEEEIFYQFAAQFGLTSRERDVLRLVLAEKTNGEIAAALSISENTVKYHIKNLLQKTGCKNRNELISLYFS